MNRADADINAALTFAELVKLADVRKTMPASVLNSPALLDLDKKFLEIARPRFFGAKCPPETDFFFGVERIEDHVRDHQVDTRDIFCRNGWNNSSSILSKSIVSSNNGTPTWAIRKTEETRNVFERLHSPAPHQPHCFSDQTPPQKKDRSRSTSRENQRRRQSPPKQKITLNDYISIVKGKTPLELNIGPSLDKIVEASAINTSFWSNSKLYDNETDEPSQSLRESLLRSKKYRELYRPRESPFVGPYSSNLKF
eukprot:TRINITY_DN116_c0_g1_i1.p1 TRINITY_DN116_c0_g1~~TRINITY_DN116_c0_g1_i1.p1  ORF type:complete len:254 (+),score=46.80 TRINITY_DN116_c0_g1_i1:714-1475(+)